MSFRLLAPGVALLLGWTTFASSQTVVRESDSLAAEVTRLADSYVREYQAAFPESALLSGLTLARHDELSDNSLAGAARWEGREDRWWERVEKIDSKSLWGRPEWITYGFLHEALRKSRETRVCRYELWPVSQLFGWQATFSLLADMQPVGTAEYRRQALARWRKLPRYLQREMGDLREGVKLGYTTPRHNVELAIAQMQRILALPLLQSPFYGPARRDPPRSSGRSGRCCWRARSTPPFSDMCGISSPTT